MENLVMFLNHLITVLVPRPTLSLGQLNTRKPKRSGWYWPIVISLVYFTLLISLTNTD